MRTKDAKRTPELVVVAGLPGSGKSHYFKGLIDGGEIDPGCLFDDFHAGAHSDSPAVRDSRWFLPLVAALKSGNDCIASDIMFCRRERRGELVDALKERVGSFTIEIRCFENASAACKRNLIERGGDSTEQEKMLVDQLSEDYAIPKNAIILQVYRKRNLRNDRERW